MSTAERCRRRRISSRRPDRPTTANGTRDPGVTALPPAEVHGRISTHDSLLWLLSLHSQRCRSLSLLRCRPGRDALARATGDRRRAAGPRAHGLWRQLHRRRGRRHHHRQRVDARLLLRLTEGDGRQVGVSVGVATGLEPAAELAVQHEQRPLPRRVHHERRSGEVARRVAPVRGIGVPTDERHDVVTVRDGSVSAQPLVTRDPAIKSIDLLRKAYEQESADV